MNIVVDKNLPFVEKAFGSIGRVTALETAEITSERIRDADALIIRSETRVDRPLLEGSRVKFIGTASIGTDHVDVDDLDSRGIAFAAAPGCNSNSVKEYVVAALLHLAGAKGLSLKGKTLGVVGAGNIGSKVAKAAEALGLTVLLNDPPLARRTGETRFVSLEELMEADVLTLHLPLTKSGPDATYRLFGRERFRRMKPGTVFINTSRGAIADTAALKNEIAEKRIGPAVIDVWENEPRIDADLVAGTTLATAHVAGYSMEGKMNAVRLVREAACRHFGISSPWDPVRELGDAGTGVVDLGSDADRLPMEEALHRIVMRAYDIGGDDKLLRWMTDLPFHQRAESFKKLRSGYRLRREFSAWTVRLSPAHEPLRETLTALGFKTAAME